MVPCSQPLGLAPSRMVFWPMGVLNSWLWARLDGMIASAALRSRVLPWWAEAGAPWDLALRYLQGDEGRGRVCLV
jgi:hypothetical protein